MIKTDQKYMYDIKQFKCMKVINAVVTSKNLSGLQSTLATHSSALKNLKK